MPLEFHKMHGAGNDFVLLDLRRQKFEINAEKAVQLADRNTGIGCDQLLVLRSPGESASLARFEVWNADGSIAEQCGNGVRCIGLYLKSIGETPDTTFNIEGPVNRVTLEARDDNYFRVNMGRPSFAAASIPINAGAKSGLYELESEGRTLHVGAVSMGNPHALMEVRDIDHTDVAQLGAAISSHAAFPRGCNAGFAEIIDRSAIKLRVFERGAAETMACGSGACAATVILIKAGKLEKEVHVNQKGGSLMIEWPEVNGPVMMTGPAVHVFTGMLS